MAKQKKAQATAVLYVRVDPKLIAALDERAAHEQRLRPTTNRSDVVREILVRELRVA